MARILVVDDRAENRDLLAYLLRYHGHTVSLAIDGAAGVRAALADPPDLVLMDIAMRSSTASPPPGRCGPIRNWRTRR